MAGGKVYENKEAGLADFDAALKGLATKKDTRQFEEKDISMLVDSFEYVFVNHGFFQDELAGKIWEYLPDEDIKGLMVGRAIENTGDIRRDSVINYLTHYCYKYGVGVGASVNFADAWLDGVDAKWLSQERMSRADLGNRGMQRSKTNLSLWDVAAAGAAAASGLPMPPGSGGVERSDGGGVDAEVSGRGWAEYVARAAKAFAAQGQGAGADDEELGFWM